MADLLQTDHVVTIGDALGYAMALEADIHRYKGMIKNAEKAGDKEAADYYRELLRRAEAEAKGQNQ